MVVRLCLALFSLHQFGRALFHMSSHPQTQADEILPAGTREAGASWPEPIYSFKLLLHGGKYHTHVYPMNKASHTAKAHINEFCNMEFASSHHLCFTEMQFSYKNQTTFLYNGESSQFIIIINSANS